MKVLLTLAAALVVFTGATVVHAQKTPTIDSIIASEGRFAVSDGSSVFRFHKDGRFTMGPVGMSGRTVEGVWSQKDTGHYTVVGKWGWINGASRGDDYRRMVIYLSYHGAEARADARHGKIYPCYVVINELVAVDEAAWKAAKAAAKKAR